jgi:hypothetical protein
MSTNIKEPERLAKINTRKHIIDKNTNTCLQKERIKNKKVNKLKVPILS